jgi:hypothetical protein
MRQGRHDYLVRTVHRRDHCVAPDHALAGGHRGAVDVSHVAHADHPSNRIDELLPWVVAEKLRATLALLRAA